MDNRKYKYVTKYEIRVNGRLFEFSKTKERRDEIVPILEQMYPDAEITAEPKRERVYL